jgi:hypothetical protein
MIRLTEILEFKYFGSLGTYDNDCGKDVRTRITAGNRGYQALSKTVISRYISKHTKLKMCTTVIKHVVLYCCETWVMAEQMKSTLRTLEQKILIKLYGPMKDQNGCRIRTNDDLQVTYRKPNIVTTSKIRRLEWAGHLVRMSDDRTVEKAFRGKPGGITKAGRPKLRWLDCTENDMKFMGVKRWRNKTEGRSVRAVILKEALVKL